MTSKEYADALLDEWSFGTDIKDQLSKHVLGDFTEKATDMFKQCKTDLLAEIIEAVNQRREGHQCAETLIMKLLTMKQCIT